MRSWRLVVALVITAPTVATALVFVERVRDGVAGVEGVGGVVALALSPDGRHLYATGATDDAIAAFDRDAVTGRLRFIEAHRDGVGGVDGLAESSDVVLSPDGRHVYVAGADDDALAVFVRDSASGALLFEEVERDGVGGVSGLAAASGVAVSPNGAHVYGAGRLDGSVATFSRDAGTGMLGFVGVVQDGVGGVDGLRGASAVLVSPDGRHVYVTGANDDAVAVFGRDPAGMLTFVEMERRGVGGVSGLGGAADVAISPEGAHVYVTGPQDDAVVVFRRDASTGRLGFVEGLRNGNADIDGLDGATGVAVSPEGARIFVTGLNDDAVVEFTRAPETGALTFLEQQRDRRNGVDGLAGATDVVVSPDAAFVYVAGRDDDSIAVFSTATILPTTTTTTLPPCPPAPHTTCRPAEASLLVLRDRGDARRDQLRWRWQGPSEGPIDFGHPRDTTDYSLCLYEERVGVAGGILGARIPGGGRCDGRPCWRAVRNVGYRYRDPARTPSGIERLVLRSALGRARIGVAGKGARLGLPALPLAPPVTAQLVGPGGSCWEAVYPTPAANGPRRLTARTR